MSTDASFSTTARVRALGRPRPRLRLPRGRSDDALVARVRAGDERAFELVFDRYHRGLLAFCRRMLASDEEAEDALQHTFMAAYRALRSSERPIRLKAWLYTIARNRCLSMLRARREHVALDDGHAASDGLAADVDRRAELRGLLADLEQLPEEQRAALVLFELGDHSHDEIAEVLGVRRDKVKALVFQARESLAGWRRARETPCVEIREQLATARGAALKRAALRRHVARCEGCAEFETEVRRQRAAMAMLLPVVPAAGLKSAVLGAAGSARAGRGRRGLAGRARRREGPGGQDHAVRSGGRERGERRLRRGARGADARRTRGRARHRVRASHRAGAGAARAARRPRQQRSPSSSPRPRPRSRRPRRRLHRSHRTWRTLSRTTAGATTATTGSAATARAERRRGPATRRARAPSGAAGATARGTTVSGAMAARNAATPATASAHSHCLAQWLRAARCYAQAGESGRGGARQRDRAPPLAPATPPSAATPPGGTAPPSAAAPLRAAAPRSATRSGARHSLGSGTAG